MRLAKHILVAAASALMVTQSFAPVTPAIAQAMQVDPEIAAYAKAVKAATANEKEEDAAASTEDSSQSEQDASADSKSDVSGTQESTDASNDDDKTEEDAADTSTADEQPQDDSDEKTNDEADIATQAATGADNWDQVTLFKKFKEAGVEYEFDASTPKLTIQGKASDAVILLSHADPRVYISWKIDINVSGSTIDTTGTAACTSTNATGMSTTASYSFDGLGSSDAPFMGEITFIGKRASFKINQPLFEAIDLWKQDFNYLIDWAGSDSEAIFAKELVNSSGVQRTATVEVNPVQRTAVSGSVEDYVQAPLFGTISSKDGGNTVINAAYKVSNDEKLVVALNRDADAGLLANDIEDGTVSVKQFAVDLSSTTAQTVPSVASTSGNAGFLVGGVKNGATLEIANQINEKGVVESTDSADATAGGLRGIVRASAVGHAAGALVGDVENNGKVCFKANANLSNLSIDGAAASGGLVGSADSMILALDGGVQVSPATKVGGDDTLLAGGLFGCVSFAEESKFNKDQYSNESITLKAKTSAGGLFGKLDLTKDVVTDKLSVQSSLGNNPANYGGVAGEVVSADKTTSLSILGDSSSLIITNGTGTATHNGGLVGQLGDGSNGSYLILDNVSVEANNVSGNFGGLIGYENTLSAVEARDVAVATGAKMKIKKGGGTIGQAAAGSVVKFSGTTDLSGIVGFGASSNVGQIIGAQDSSLVYAVGNGENANISDSSSGWTLKRPSKAAEVDDIGNYGEVIRLGEDGLDSGLISFNKGNATINKKLANGETLDLSSKEDFARLAITWQSHGYFSGVEGVNTDNWNNVLVNSKIEISSGIDLSGTGLIGFMRDNNDDRPYDATVNGNGNAVTLAIGESYGTRGGQSVKSVTATDEGNGKIYRHSNLGLFAKCNGDVKNLSINGNIIFKCKNNIGINVGALSGLKNGNGANDKKESGARQNASNLDGVKTNVVISVETDNDSSECNVGNIYGTLQDAGGQNALSLGRNVKVEITSNISTKNTLNSASVRIGGMTGYVTGTCSAAIDVDDVEILGGITARTNSSAMIAGGFIGEIGQNTQDIDKKVNIQRLSLDRLNLSFSSPSSVGGFLGYSWSSTDVTIGVANNTSYAITTNGASLNANNATYVGGLANRASGRWVLAGKALSYEGASFKQIGRSDDSGSTFGMIIYLAGAQDDGKSSGCYLECTSDWDNAYKLDDVSMSNISSTHFDEWVGDSRGQKSKDIFASDVNGVVSLHTTNAAGVDALRVCNTYQNRTPVGKDKKTKTNSYTRYYYNLDVAGSSVDGKGDGCVDTPEELLLWSVHQYAAGFIKKYFTAGDAASSNEIGPKSGSAQTLDMTGYSYYPVDISNQDVSIQNVTIKFANKTVEDLEADNKPPSSDGQHRGMHSGLLRNFTCDTKNTALNMSGVTLSGSIGMLQDSNGSLATGALICGKVSGKYNNGSVYKAKVSISGALDGIGITNFNPTGTDYAPLLVNTVESYVDFSINGLKAKGYAKDGTNRQVATSLIGNVGSADAVQINFDFQRVSIPSNLSDGLTKAIFTKASLLMSLNYKENSTAKYTFSKSDDEANQVTYGYEIDAATSVYKGQQYWYNGVDHTGNDGLVSDKAIVGDTSCVIAMDGDVDKGNPAFGYYLPYVATSKKNGASSTDTDRKEIAVNHEVVGITDGCGTYGHPFKITTEKQLNTIKDIINNGSMTEGWSVRLYTNPSDVTKATEMCAGNDVKDSVYTADSSSTLKNDADSSISLNDLREYMRNAYYAIASNITITDFEGLGTNDWGNAFRGVIVGENNATLTINASSKACKGLIAYSFGSVVKDLTIKFTGDGENITYQSVSEEPVNRAPKSFFGGAIGIVLGGDNVIDNVKVSGPSDFVKRDGSKPNLIPVGGYVGVITGGGVMFRNMSDDKCAAGVPGSSGKTLYTNTYVGRVVNGYAFSDGCSIDNGNDDYKINEIDESDKGTLSTIQDGSNYTVSIGSGRDLLILTGIVNSGAASGKSTLSYGGAGSKYGKARSAKYEYVGSPSAEGAINDFKQSVQDDDMGSNPYLVAKHADEATGKICSDFGIYSNSNTTSYEFAKNSTIDMRPYGNGYRGVGARYVSSAGLVDDFGSKNNMPASVIPVMKSLSGNDSKLLFDIDFKVYANDDLQIIGVGGLSGVGYIQNSPKSSKNLIDRIDGLQIGSGAEGSASKVVFSYIDSTGKPATLNEASLESGRKAVVAVGGLIGVAVSNNSSNPFAATARNVSLGTDDTQKELKSLILSSPGHAGGIFGCIGYASFQMTDVQLPYLISSMENNKTRVGPLRFQNCTYSNISIEADRSAGGLLGYASLSDKGGLNGVSTTNGVVLGRDSRISSNSKYCYFDNWGDAVGYAGGVVGFVKNDFNINRASWNEENTPAVMDNVEISSLHNAADDADYAGSGGAVGRFENPNSCELRKIKINQSLLDAPNSRGVGGLVGAFNGKGSPKLTECEILNAELGAKDNAAGLVGRNESTSGVLTADDIVVQNCTITGSASGGAIGGIQHSGEKVKLKNARLLENNIVTANSGAIFGWTKGTHELSNILLRNTTYSAKNSQGILTGSLEEPSKGAGNIHAAGVEVQLVRMTNDSLPANLCQNVSDSNLSSHGSYVAFGNYNADPWNDQDDSKNTVTLLGDTKDSAATAADPWVSTSPKSAGNLVTTDSKYLFGDGANVNTVRSILDDKEHPAAASNKFIYKNAPSLNVKEEGGCISSVKANNTGYEGKDFPVLLVTGGDSNVISNYLDVVTNGGYSAAIGNSSTAGDVSVNIQAYKINDAGQLEATGNPSLRKSGEGTTGMKIERTAGYDNELKQITLLTVTFTVADQKFIVHVPVIVKRVLEYNILESFKQGTDFDTKDYTADGGGALLGFGESMTGYYKFTYNMAGNEETEYGFDSYLSGGGSLKRANKTFTFEGGDTKYLPAGTKLTLVDVTNGGKAYSYTGAGATKGELTGEVDKLTLDDFSDANGNKPGLWLSDKKLMDVQAEESGNGIWVVCDKEEALNSAQLNGKTTYFRLATSDELAEGSTAKKYALTVAKGANGKERTPSEEYLLTAYFPNKVSEGDQAAVNGNAGGTVVFDSGMAINTHKNEVVPGVSGTVRTYSVMSGYGQNLTDKSSESGTVDITTHQNEGSGNGYKLTETIDDEVTAGKNVWSDGHELYYSLGLSAQTNESVYRGFPSGTMGKATFYVIGKNGQHYSWNGSTWAPVGEGSDKGISYEWSSSGFVNLELKSGSDGKLIDLAKMRSLSGGAFTIRTVIELDLTDEVSKEFIPLSNDEGETANIRFMYKGALSSTASSNSLLASSWVSEKPGNPAYYRKDSGRATISLVATKPSQLGINLDDLKSADGTIATLGTLDLSKFSNADDIMSKARSVTYTISLEKKDENGQYASVPINEYVRLISSDGLTASGSDDYTLVDSGLKTRKGASASFEIPLEFKVDTTLDKHGYSNYRIRLAATLNCSDGTTSYTGESTRTSGQKYDYITYTLTRVNLEGIS